MMIVFVILIYFNGLLVSSEGNYLPFLYPTDYSIMSNTSYYANVSFPSTLEFESSCSTHAYVRIVCTCMSIMDLLFRLRFMDSSLSMLACILYHILTI